MKLPTFIIGGAPKAGTTSLYHYLSSHPDVFMSPVKEPDYFDKHYHRGLDWYASLFDGRTQERCVGEASVDTLASPEALERVYDLIPDMRFVFALRDPADRAHSHYWFEIMRGGQRETRPFSSFIRDESNPWRNRVIELGMYGEQVERYVERFGRDQVCAVRFEDLGTDRAAVLTSVLEFIGADSDALPAREDRKTHNVTVYPKRPGAYRAIRMLWDPIRARLGGRVFDWLYPIRSAVRDRFFSGDQGARPPLTDVDRAYLAAVYRSSNERLESLLGWDLSDWSGPES